MNIIEFKSLDNISTTTLLDTFNKSFADYIVKLQLSKEQLENKIISDSINMKLSVGAFTHEILVGFILHGIDIMDGEKVIYNAGTGVIPDHRGNHLTKAMYDFILPKLKAENVSKCSLEVIDNNIAALKTYSEIGFNFKRELLCFKGNVQLSNKPELSNIRIIDSLDWDIAKSFWDWQPSWQNSIRALRNIGENNKTIGFYQKDVLRGYLNWNPLNYRIAQFAVDKNYRRQGIASLLFLYILNINNSEISIINIDKKSSSTIQFLNAIGLNHFITQFEMELTIQ